MRDNEAFREMLGCRLDPDFAFCRGFPFPDGRGAFELCDCPFACFESFLAVLSAGDYQYDVFTNFDVADAMNDAHVDKPEILDSFFSDFAEFLFRHLWVMLKVEFGNALAFVQLPTCAEENSDATDIA